MFSVACVLSGQFCMRVKWWDTDNLVLFRMFLANGYQLMSDEQRVSSDLHFPGIFYCSCNCMCWVAWRRSPVPPHVCHYSMLSVACVLLGQFRMRVKRWDSDNLVFYCLFSANGYQLMSDEQRVSSYLHFPGIFYCSCNCMCWVACTVLLSSGTCKRLWLLFHWFCSFCVRCVCAWFDLNVWDTMDVSSWHVYFLDSLWVSLQNPLIWCN